MMKNLLKQVAEDVSNGWSLSYSFAQRGEGKLPVTFIETVYSGEESGDLVSAFERMSKYYDRMNKTREKATSALIYPAFVIFVAVIVVGIIMTKAVPTFSTTFDEMGIELPLVTKILIAVSHFMSRYILLIVTLIAAVILAVRLYSHTENGAEKLDRLKLGIPIVGRIGVMAGASQFAHTMATMLSAGMPILQALDVAARSMSNICMSNAILNIIPGVEAGRSVGECMRMSRDLPDMLVQMTAVGEATGSMEATLEVLAEFYDNEVDTTTARALSLLEPTIICVLAVFVVIILMAVYLPMFSMYDMI
jgi:type IV pilus assembly protein PilC